MNLSVLATLSAVLEKGSFATASQAVGCTPGAVSLQMKQLESFLGQPLFDRSARTVRPTPLAHEVDKVARELHYRLEALRMRRSMQVAGRLRLGAIASVQTDVLPQALRVLREKHPALEPVVTMDDTDALLARLRAADVEGAILVRPNAGGSSRLHWRNLARQPFVMLMPADAPAGRPAELLHRHGWIRYDPALTGGRLAARFVQQVCPGARVVMDLRSIDAIVAMVSAGLGVSVVPHPRPALLQASRVRPIVLGRQAPGRQIAFVCRLADAEHCNIVAVAEALRSSYADLGVEWRAARGRSEAKAATPR